MNITLRQPRGLRWLQTYYLYRSSFPRSERKPFSMIVKMARASKTDLWCLEREGKFVGLAATINSPELVLVDYFAICKAHRGEGIGTAALQTLMEHYRDYGFFLEIETTLGQAPNQAEREKRKRFYLAAGLEELHTTAELFGVDMELLGTRCQLDFEGYRKFYRDNYSDWAAEHVKPIA